MKKIKRALRRLRAKTRGIISRGGDGGGAPRKDGGGARFRESRALWQLASFAIAIIVSVAVFAGLSLCELGANYDLPPFVSSRCESGSRIAGNMSVGAGAGFVVFLFMEVTGMVFGQLLRERRADAAERRADIAEFTRRLETAELSRRVDVAELKSQIAEQSRIAEAAELSRRADAAEGRAEIAELRAEVAEQTRKAEIAEQTRRAEVSELTRRVEAAEFKAQVAEQSRRAEAERAARLELELELATRNAENNGESE